MTDPTFWIIFVEVALLLILLSPFLYIIIRRLPFLDRHIETFDRYLFRLFIVNSKSEEELLKACRGIFLPRRLEGHERIDPMVNNGIVSIPKTCNENMAADTILAL